MYIALVITIFFLYSEVAVAIEDVNSDTSNNIVICIDPGHGGENLGAEFLDYTEKEMTLTVANAMRDELEKYEGITVYLTREGDEDLSLQKRADIAKSVGADFFFCLHFNMSENHDKYGAENWISAFGSRYAKGMDFAKIEMSLLTDLGLYDRGVKTRLNNKGVNYYGVLRATEEYGIPGVIIEHCHLDNENDQSYYDHRDLLVKYGQLDATAVAMYYGLKSDVLGKDYTNYSYEPTPVPNSVVSPDTSNPEECSFVVEAINDTGEGGEVVVSITATDPDSRMLYYSVSLDGGLNYSKRYPWQGEEGENGDTIKIKIDIPYNKYINLRILSFNLYDLTAESEITKLEPLTNSEQFVPNSQLQEALPNSSGESTDGVNEQASKIDDYNKDVTEIEHVSSDNKSDNSIDKMTLIFVVLLIMLALAAIAITAYTIAQFQHKKRKRRKRRRQ